MRLTDKDTYHLGRYLAGAPSIDLDALSCPDVHAAALAMLQVNGGDRAEALRRHLTAHCDPAESDQVIRRIIACDINGPPPDQVEPPRLEVPELPAGAAPDPEVAKGAGGWLDRYVEYAMQVSPMTPRLFHEGAALWLASVAVARRLRILLSAGPIYPNLFIACIAPTTLYSKTTGMRLARRLAARTFGHLLLPQESTPEALLADLAGREPANLHELDAGARSEWEAQRPYAGQRGWALDEMSGLLAGAGKDYNAGLIEAYLRLYDCDPDYRKYTRGQGWILIRNAYLSLLSASTPAALARHLDASVLWANGWWPRFALLTPDRAPVWQVANAPISEPAGLVDQLAMLYHRLPTAAWPAPAASLSVQLGAGVFEAWQRYFKAVRFDLLVDGQLDDERLHGTYGRLGDQALKVALLAAALDWPTGADAPRIELPHMARGILTAESWRASAHRLVALKSENAYQAFTRRVLVQLGRFEPQGATLRDLGKAMRDARPDNIRDALTQLQELGEVEKRVEAPGQKGGRPAERYRLARE